jgi:hypothetical protein
MATAFDATYDTPQPQVDPYSGTIQTIEGWYPGSKSYQNNNPGNLKFADQPGASGADSQGFARFPDYQTGMAALHKQIALDASRGLSIQDFAKKYAPSQDGNDPTSYAAQLAKAAGRKPTDPLGNGAFDESQDAFSATNDKPVKKPAPPPSAWDMIKQAGAAVGNAASGVGDYIAKTNKNLIPSLEGMFHNPFDPQPGVGGALQNPNAQPGDFHNRVNQEAAGLWNMVRHPLDTFQQNPTPFLTMGAGSLLPKGEAATAGAEGLIPGTPEFQGMLQSATKPMIEALKPANPLAFEESMQRAFPLLLEENPNIENIIRNSSDLRELTGTPNQPGIIQHGLDTLHGKFNDLISQHQLAGDRIDGNLIANEKMSAIPPKLQGTDPNAYAEMVKEANSYRRPMTPAEVQSYLETTNDQAAGIYDKLPGERNISVGASAAKGQVITEANAFREQLYKALDPEHNGAWARAIQLRRGSLIDFKNQLESANADIMRSPTPSTAQKLGAAYDTVKSILPTSDSTAGPAVNRAAQAMQNPRTIQGKIADGFKAWKGAKLPEAPSAPAITSQWENTAPYPQEPTTPSDTIFGSMKNGKPVFGSQVRTPAPPPSAGTPEDGFPPPRYGSYPSMPGMPARPKFQWQRELFGDEIPGIPGNTKVPPPRYPGQPPSSSMEGSPELPAGKDYTDAEVIQHQLLGGRQLGPGKQNTLPPYAPKLLESGGDATKPTSTPNPPPTFTQGGGPYRIVSRGGAELGSYANLSDAQKAVDKATRGYKTGQYEIHYKNQRLLSQ